MSNKINDLDYTPRRVLLQDDPFNRFGAGAAVALRDASREYRNSPAELLDA